MKLVPVQVLRAVAALSVAVLHGLYETGLLAATSGRSFTPVAILPWEAGVDVFFVISGFVMVFASRGLFGRRGAWHPFLARRVARVVPLYWLTTTAYLAIALATPGLVNAGMQPLYVLASYAFIPAARPDGTVQPLYSLGWTLNYEMFFYGLLAVGLGLRPRQAVAAVAAALVGLALVVRLASAPLPLAFWGDPIVLEFAFGMVLGLARAEGLLLGPAMRIGLGLVGLALFVALPQIAPALPRPVAYGVPAAALVAACGLGREHELADETLATRIGALLGDASYALYLVHPFAIRGLRQLVTMAGLTPAIPPSLFLAIALAGASAVAIAVFILVERPLTRRLRRWLEPRPAALPRTTLQ